MKRTLLALTLLAALPFAASAADGVSYTYVEGGYTATNTDAGDADGWALKGSGAIAPNFHLFGEFDKQEIENTNIDVDNTEIGFGYAHGLTDRMDLIAEAAYLNTDVQYFGDVDGYRASIGLRGSFTENFEGLIKANYNDGDNADGDFTGTIGAQYKFSQTWGMVGEATFGDNGETYLVGLRASF